MEVSVENLTMKYKEKVALYDVSLNFTKGIYGLLGANGAGKTTFINILVGNLISTEGIIKYDGTDITKLGKHYRAKLGYMPQQQNMYNYMTGYEFLLYMAALKGLSYNNLQDEIEKLIKKVNLTDKIHKKVGEYSGGMKQRLLLVQALLGNPEIIILDEPTAGLDPKERIHVRNIISEYAMENIVIIATHIVTDIEFIAKEIIILKDGVCIEKGKPHNLNETMQGKVYEIKTDLSEISNIKNKYLVSNLYKEEDDVYVRIISDTPIKDYDAKMVKPNLEDKYLYIFENKLEGEYIE